MARPVGALVVSFLFARSVNIRLEEWAAAMPFIAVHLLMERLIRH